MISAPQPKAQLNTAVKSVTSTTTANGASWVTASSVALPFPKSSARSFAQTCKHIGQHLYRILILFLLLIGLCTVFDEVIGDGTLPRFNELKTVAPALISQAKRNTTYIFNYQSDAKAWSALKPSRELLTALSPEIAAWLYDLHQKQQIVYREPSHTDAKTYGLPTDTPLIAAYRHLDGKLYLGKAFWALPDGQKIAVLAHEYRHFRQNPPKRFSRQLAQLMGGGRLHYTSTIEDEAFAYEKQAQAALGL